MKLMDLLKRKETAEKELEQISGNLDGLKEQQAALADQITGAIDSNDFALVEELTAEQAKIENKIKATKLILDRKTGTGTLDPEEVKAANNAEMKEYQKKIDKAQGIADDARREYFRKQIEVAALIGQAWQARADYISLIPGIENPHTINAQTTDFDSVKTPFVWNRNREEEEIINEIRPDGLALMVDARRDRFDSYSGRDHTPRDTGVIVSKYNHYQ